MADRLLPDRSNAVLWLLLGLLGVVAVLYFYVQPERARLVELRAKSQASQEDIAVVQAQIDAITALDATLAEQSNQLNRLTVAVPTGDGLGELLVMLQDTATQAGVVLTSIQPAVATDQAGPTLSLAVRGSYGGIRLFVAGAEALIRPVTISKLSISASSSVPGASLVSASMTLTAASLVQVQPEAPVATPEGATGA